MNPKAPHADCDNCPLRDEPLVPGVGPGQADIVIVGEGPGKDEVRKGEPFVGRSGQLLNKAIADADVPFTRSETWITNAVLCRPPGNRTPTTQELRACRDRLLQEIRDRRPRVVFALGGTAAKTLTQSNDTITTLRSQPPIRRDDLDGATVVSSFHPAYCLRDHSKYPSLVQDLAKAKREQAQVVWEYTKYKVYDELEPAILALQAQWSRSSELTIDVEIEHNEQGPTDRHHPKWLCIGISHEPGKAVVYTRDVVLQPKYRYWLRKALADRSKSWVMQHGKFDIQQLWEFAPEARVDEDTMLLHALVDERKGIHDLETMAVDILGAPRYKTDTKQYLPRKGAPLSLLPPHVLYEYNAADADITHRLLAPLRKDAANDGVENIYRTLLIPGANALAKVEYRGVAVDFDAVSALEESLTSTIAERRSSLEGFVRNPNSPKQLIEAFADLGLVLDSTNKEVLNEMIRVDAPGADEARRLLAYRQVQKMFSTYVKAIRRLALNGRIHTEYTQHVAETGRLSSKKPNMQNVPRIGGLRDMFIASPGRVLVSSDYSAIELRLMAEFSNDPYMLEAFADPTRNLHRELAARVFGPDYDDEQYVYAKTIRFGSIYLETAKHLAERSGRKESEAREVQEEMFRRSPAIKQYWDIIAERIKRDHYLRSYFGRVRRFWLIMQDNWKDIWKEGVNFMIQGPASDLTQGSLIELEKLGLDCVITVHDSLTFDVPSEHYMDAARTIKRVMETSPWSVPTPVELKVGHSWGHGEVITLR